MSVEDSEDDHEGGGYECPGKNADFAPEGPAMFAGLGVGLASQEGVLFFFVAVAGFRGGGAIFGQERLLVFCHGECQLSIGILDGGGVENAL